MTRKDKHREAKASGFADETLKELAQRASTLDASSESLPALLDEIAALSPAALSQFTVTLAREGQETSLPVLTAMNERKATAPAAAEALGWIKSQKAAQRLLRLSEASPSREVRKAASRGLYRLRSQGLHVEEPVAKEAIPAREPIAAPAAKPESRAWTSAVDGAGNRFLFLSVPQPLEGRALVFLMISDKDGILEARVGELKDEHEDQARVDRVASESQLPHVDIPFEYARLLVKEARERTRAGGRIPPTEYMVWKELIGEPEGGSAEPPIYHELNAAKVLLEPGVLEGSDYLVDLPEFRTWLPAADEIAPYAKELEDLTHGSLVLPPASQAERQENIISGAIEHLLQDDGKRRYKRRLEDMAYVLLHTGKEREAKWALAAAVALERERESRHSGLYLPGSKTAGIPMADTSSLAQHPFFRRLVTESLNKVVTERARGRKLIV